MKGQAIREMLLVLCITTFLSLMWLIIIMSDGLKAPNEVVLVMQSHIEQFGGFFILFDVLVVGLIFRWITLARKPKKPVNIWEYSNDRLK